MSFLSAFRSILHAAEAASQIAAPIVAATVDPTIGALMAQATQAAVGVESVITTPGSGAQKADLVKQQTLATIGVINSILQAEGKTPLASNVADIVSQQVSTVVQGLNAVQKITAPSVSAPAVAQ